MFGIENLGFAEKNFPKIIMALRGSVKNKTEAITVSITVAPIISPSEIVIAPISPNKIITITCAYFPSVTNIPETRAANERAIPIFALFPFNAIVNAVDIPAIAPDVIPPYFDAVSIIKIPKMFPREIEKILKQSSPIIKRFNEINNEESSSTDKGAGF